MSQVMDVLCIHSVASPLILFGSLSTPAHVVCWMLYILICMKHVISPYAVPIDF